jgi:hypothetical protein
MQLEYCDCERSSIDFVREDRSKRLKCCHKRHIVPCAYIRAPGHANITAGMVGRGHISIAGSGIAGLARRASPMALATLQR